jgi:hypothetical protein
MQPTIKRLSVSVFQLIVTLGLCGCAHTISLKYTPSSSIDSLPLAATKHQIVVAKFADARADKTVFRAGANSTFTNDDVGALFAGAAADALRKAGLQNTRLDSSIQSDIAGQQSVPAEADFLIVGKVTNLTVTTDVGWSNVSCKGLATFQYRVISRGQAGGWSSDVKGESLTELPAVQYSDISNFIDSAMQRCMENFARSLNSSGVLNAP